jgi:hypothetical protein
VALSTASTEALSAPRAAPWDRSSLPSYHMRPGRQVLQLSNATSTPAPQPDGAGERDRLTRRASSAQLAIAARVAPSPRRPEENASPPRWTLRTRSRFRSLPTKPLAPSLIAASAPERRHRTSAGFLPQRARNGTSAGVERPEGSRPSVCCGGAGRCKLGQPIVAVAMPIASAAAMSARSPATTMRSWSRTRSAAARWTAS